MVSEIRKTERGLSSVLILIVLEDGLWAAARVVVASIGMGVLILIVLEDGLWGPLHLRLVLMQKRVLILIVLEDGLWALGAKEAKTYYNVLILIVLEDGLWVSFVFPLCFFSLRS